MIFKSATAALLSETVAAKVDDIEMVVVPMTVVISAAVPVMVVALVAITLPVVSASIMLKSAAATVVSVTVAK